MSIGALRRLCRNGRRVAGVYHKEAELTAADYDEIAA
jgi:hypothetical protein